MSKFTDVSQRGTNAARPAANAVPTGALYYDTTNNQMTRSNGSTWDIVEGSGGMTNPMTTQDDIIIGGSSGTPARLAKGSDGQVLTVSPSTHHLVWAAAAGGGSASGYGAFASKPAAGTAGNLYTPSDGYAAPYVDDGAAWRPIVNGVVGGLPPIDSSWTYQAFNSASGTHSDDAGTVLIHQAGHDTNDRLSAMWQTAGGTFDVKACLLHDAITNNYTLFGLLVRSSSVMWHVSCIYNAGGVGWAILVGSADHTTGVLSTTVSSQALGVPIRWFRIKSDGTNLTYYYSFDTSPKDWIQIYTHLVSVLGTITDYGFFCNARNASGSYPLDVRLVSWTTT